MNKFSRDYYVYKVLLESNLSTRQRELLLMNEGFKDAVGSVVDKVKGFFGFGKDTKNLGDGAEILVKNPDFAKSVESLKKPLGAAINNMTTIAKKLNIPDPKRATAAIINQILNDEGVSTSDIANPQPIAAPGKSSSSGKSAAGTPIKSDSPTATASLVRSAAEAQGASTEKAKETATKAEEQNVTPQRAAKLLGNAVASTSGVPAKDCITIVSALMDAGKLNTGKQTNESLRASKKDILTALHEIETFVNLQERWQLLSGTTNLLVEREMSPEVLKRYETTLARIEKGEIKDEQSLAIAMKSMGKDTQFSKSARKSLVNALKKQNPKVDEKKVDNIITTSTNTATSDSSSPDQAVQRAQEEFSTTFSLLVKKLKGQVDPGNIGKVLVALDDLESLDVQKG